MNNTSKNCGKIIIVKKVKHTIGIPEKKKECGRNILINMSS